MSTRYVLHLYTKFNAIIYNNRVHFEIIIQEFKRQHWQNRQSIIIAEQKWYKKQIYVEIAADRWANYGCKIVPAH